MKNVLILSGSPRKEGNSDLLCTSFMKGAKENGNNVKIMRIAEMKIDFCSACYYCSSHNGECVKKDDMLEIMNAIIESDILVFASPVYFYSIDAQLKTVIDRTVCRWTEVKDKEFYYILTSADNTKAAMDGSLACLRGYAKCVSGAKEKGVLYGTGLYEKGTIRKTQLIEKAYMMGNSL